MDWRWKLAYFVIFGTNIGLLSAVLAVLLTRT